MISDRCILTIKQEILDSEVSPITKLNLNTAINKIVFDTVNRKKVEVNNSKLSERILYLINEEPNKHGKIIPNSKYTIAQRMASAIKKSDTFRNMLSKDEIHEINSLINYWSCKSRNKAINNSILLSNAINKENILDFINQINCPMDRLLLSLYTHLGKLDYPSVILENNLNSTHLKIMNKSYEIPHELKKIIDESIRHSPRKYLIGHGDKFVSHNSTFKDLKRIFSDNAKLIHQEKNIIVNYAEIDKIF